MSTGVFAEVYGVDLLCVRPPHIGKEELLGVLAARCPGVEAREPDPSSLAFVHPRHLIHLADATIAPQLLVRVNAGSPDLAAIEPALQQSWDFPQARSEVSQCRAAVFTADFMSGRLERKSRLDLFQRAVRGVLDLVDCRAIHWRASGRVVEPARYRVAFDGGGPAQLFQAAAVNVRMFSAGDGDLIMDTLGLGALGLPDLEVRYRRLEPGSVAQHLFNTAWYLFNAGDVIADGHTISGATPGSQWRCKRSSALVAPQRTVLSLDPGRPA
jgi:hypothetical protein